MSTHKSTLEPPVKVDNQ
jgi:hypothetical protein